MPITWFGNSSANLATCVVRIHPHPKNARTLVASSSNFYQVGYDNQSY